MIYKRGKWFWMDSVVDGARYREPLKTTNWQTARTNEKDRLKEIADGKVGARGPTAKQTFDVAVDTYIEERKLHSAEKTYRTDKERSKPLKAFFGKHQIRKVTAKSIAEYQGKRREGTVSGRTVNLEVGLLRRVLKKNKQWGRIGDDVLMLPEQPKGARVLSPEEKKILMETAALKTEWQIARCAAAIALNTTMRSCEIRGLQWRDLDWIEMTVTIRRESTKTNAGARRIPLNTDAVLAFIELKARADELKSGELTQFVLPSCEHGNFDATKPMKNWRTAWRSLTVKAGLAGLRFHDLRHQAITELAEGGLSDQTIMSIAGHVSRQMLNHYSHIRLDAKRQAVDTLHSDPSKKVPRQAAMSQSASQTEKPAEAGLPSPSESMGPTGLEPMTSCV
jgi:integrase